MQSELYRQHVEQLEQATLSPYAMLSQNTRGREHPMEQCPIRTDFVRDRDRIIHCKSFRRLKHKTQVFLAPTGDHYRTRLTHTLEVAQIARTLSRALRLNEDLTEAIALGHDLGHTPFGHTGEAVLNNLVPGGFQHNVQSLRVVEVLENGTGLNLTFEVRDGIVNHKKDGQPATLEGKVVSLADRIAYINHDIDDAIRAGVLTEAQLPADTVAAMGKSQGQRINSLILDILKESFGKPSVQLSQEMGRHFNLLRDFMFENVYHNPEVKQEEARWMNVIAELYYYYLDHMEHLPKEFSKNLEKDGAEQVAADYIACMTDQYAMMDHARIFDSTL